MFNMKCILAMAAALAVTPAGNAALIGFEDYAAGTVIDSEYFASLGVTFDGVNLARGGIGNLATVFDTGSPTGGDTDLASPFSNAGLGMMDPGHVLILHEHPRECDGTTCTDPDDEGSRRAGYFEIDFGSAVTLNSIDFFDVEGPENGTTPDNAIRLFDESLLEISPGTFYTPATGGDNTWDRLLFGIEGVSSLRLYMGGSGAIDHINFTRPPDDKPPEVPVPTTALLLAIGIAGLAGIRRAQRPS